MTVALLRLANMGTADGCVCLESMAILQAMRGSAKASRAADVHDRFRTRVCASLSQRNSLSKLGWAAVIIALVHLQEEQPYAAVPDAQQKFSHSFIHSFMYSCEHVSCTRVG